MKIAILHSGDMKSVSMGGVDRYIKSLIEFFDDDEITVYGTGKYGEVKLGYKYQRNYHGKRYSFIPIAHDLKKPLSIYYMINEFKWLNELSTYDCVYAQRTEYSVPFIISKKGRSKLIQIIHGSSKYSDMGFGRKMAKIHLFLEALSIRIAKKTFVILNRKEFGTPYYKTKYPKYKDRILYARNPINPDHFCKMDKKDCRRELNIDEDATVIVYTGRVEHNPKRVLLLPEICKKLNEYGRHALFVIVGDGNDMEKLKDIVSTYHLSNQFYFAGFVENSETIAKFFNAADMAINISMFEGTCTSNLEALATGTPVVSTDVGDIREVLDGTNNGIIIGNSNDDTLVFTAAQAIMSICDNPPAMDESYMNYAGFEVIRELRREMCIK